MPVPSTMMGFRLTTVLMPIGRVVSATARIITSGPIAMTRFAPCRSISSFRAVVTSPLMPLLPSSVATMTRSHTRDISFS